MLAKLFLAVAVVVCVSTVAVAQEAGDRPVLSFADFSDRALKYYPKLKAAHSDVDIALAKQMEASAGFWPSLNLSGGYTVSDDPVNVFGMLLRQERFTAGDF